ncbi:MAG: phosphoribosylglycinamide formyltransferase [Flavobacteriaceae bacterium]|nr:phosphoribosylglycinamide formyltransferase [Flavobacteriaceae bacterium]
MKTITKKLILLASGDGSNVENIIKYFKNTPNIEVVLVAGNNKNAYVFERVEPFNIETLVFTKSYFNNKFVNIIELYHPDLIILAGFLWKIPELWINKYPNKIINIHPSLLPSFGGKGMYGSNVHEAVINSKVKKTGISIHIVNKEYDEGNIIFQAEINVLIEDTPESIARRVQILEKEHFPRVIKEYLFKIE